MSQITKFKCNCCGEIHETWPALAFSSPDNYDCLSDVDKINIGKLDTDFCTINYGGEIAMFIRCTLIQKVKDYCENLNYGLWVSLSEKSFTDYKNKFKKESNETGYFGWLCNDLKDYEITESIPMDVITRSNGQRPELIPHKNFEHNFVTDYYNGISKVEAEKRISDMLAIVEKNENKQSKTENLEIKKWWEIWK